MNRFKNLPIIINFFLFRSFLLLVVSFREENLSLFGIYKYMNWLIWTKIKNLKCYRKHSKDGNVSDQSQEMLFFDWIVLNLNFECLSAVLVWPSGFQA